MATSTQQKQLMAAQQKRFDILFKRPENRECFDCQAKQPRWASTNLGIFFCLRCAGIHRSLGVHISKVKSSTMDLWDEYMVQCCERIGNGNGKLLYEARLPPTYRKPESSTDTAVVERLLRQKYEQKLFYAIEFEELRDRLLAASPHTSAPTPNPYAFSANNSAAPFAATTTTPTTVLATPTFSVGGASPPDEWGVFQSSPVTATSTSSGHPVMGTNSRRVTQQQQQSGDVDVWGDFSTGAVVAVHAAAPHPVRPSGQHQSDLFGGPSTSTGANNNATGMFAQPPPQKQLDDLFSSHHIGVTPSTSSSVHNPPATGRSNAFDIFDTRGGPVVSSSHGHGHQHHRVQHQQLQQQQRPIDQSSPAAILAMFNQSKTATAVPVSNPVQGPVSAPRPLAQHGELLDFF